MNYSLFFLPLLLLLPACKWGSCGDEIDANISIQVVDSLGNNLLPDSINYANIRLKYLENGKVTEVYDYRMDCPTSVCYEDDSLGIEIPMLHLFPNIAESEAYPITYLVWPNGDTNTIRCHYLRMCDGGTIICDTVWYNDVRMVPDHIIGGRRLFQVTK